MSSSAAGVSTNMDESEDLVEDEGLEDDSEGEVPLWQSAILFIVAALVIQAQVFFVSCVVNIVLRQFVLPKGIAYKREFHPDYQAPEPVAHIPILDDKYLTSGQLLQKPEEAGLLVRDGSYFDVWLRLSLPYTEKNEALFQVQVDLLAMNASSVFSARKTCLMRRKNFLLRHFRLAALGPLYLAGFLQDGEETLYFPVVTKFKQGSIGKVADVKVSQLRVTLLPQKDRDPPELYQSEAHVLIKLNFVQHFMYHYPITSFIVLSCALAVVLNSLLMGVFLAVLAALFLGGGSEDDDDEEEGGERGSSGSEDESEEAKGGPSEDQNSSKVSTEGVITDFDEEGGGEAKPRETDTAQGTEDESSDPTPWQPTTTTSPSDASPENASTRTQVLKTGSKKYITETQARQRKGLEKN